MGFKGLGFRVEGVGFFGVQGLELRVSGFSRPESLNLEDPWLRIQIPEPLEVLRLKLFRVLGIRASGLLEFQASGFLKHSGPQ